MISRRRFVLGVIGGAFAGVLPALGESQADEVILEIRHDKAIGFEVERRGIDGAWHKLAKGSSANAVKVVDRIFREDSFQYRSRSILPDGVSSWTVSEWV